MILFLFLQVRTQGFSQGGGQVFDCADLKLSVSLYFRFPATVNLFLSLPNHQISHSIPISKA